MVPQQQRGRFFPAIARRMVLTKMRHIDLVPLSSPYVPGSALIDLRHSFNQFAHVMLSVHPLSHKGDHPSYRDALDVPVIPYND